MRGRKFPKGTYSRTLIDCTVYTLHETNYLCVSVSSAAVGGQGVRTQYVIAPSQPRTSAESLSFIFPQGGVNVVLLKHQIQAQHHLNFNLSCTILGKD